MPTDFFIAAGRAGFDAGLIGRMLDQAVDGEAGGANEAGTETGPDGTDRGSAQVLGAQNRTFRNEAEVREYLDLFLRRNFSNAPGMTAARLSELRRSLQQEPQQLRAMLCEAGFSPGRAVRARPNSGSWLKP